MSGLERDRELLFCGKWLRGDIWSDREELAMHRSGRSLSGRWGSKNPRSEISCMPEEYIGGRCVWSRWRQGREAGEEEEREARQALLHPNLSSMAPCRPCSLAKLCPALCNPMDCSAPGSLVLHHLPELAQTQVHCVGLFQWVPVGFKLWDWCHPTGLLVEQRYLFIFQRWWWTSMCSSIQSTCLAPQWWWLACLEWYQAPLYMGFSRPKHWHR